MVCSEIEGSRWPHFLLLFFDVVVLDDCHRFFIQFLGIVLDSEGISNVDLTLTIVDIPVRLLTDQVGR